MSPEEFNTRRRRDMDKGKTGRTVVDRRTVLKAAASAGVAGAGAFSFARPARAADTTLAIWTGFPECQPFYQAVADAYTKLHPEVKVTVFSTSLREMEQKLSAAVPTGTGPDIFFFQAEDGIRDLYVTGVQTCALPI